MIVLEEYCHKQNLKCDIVRSGEEAIQKVIAKLHSQCCKEYKLIFCDLNFGHGYISGIEAAREIKKQIITLNRTMSTKIICSSGDINEINSLNDIHDNPFWEGVGKPISYEKFLSIIDILSMS